MTTASWCLQAGPGRLGAVALASRVGPGTGHIIQLAVDPQFQRRGTGAALLEAACGSAARAGCRRMTLLVAGPNRTARKLYEEAGFAPTASFVAAGTLDAAGQPRRLTSVALGERLTTFR
ncbi:MAG: GNAT family N-acetyltransferase [Acidobacteria bacterium]|nr:GNAT family N-acetyltransferase [Acidobacteriota bacterium]